MKIWLQAIIQHIYLWASTSHPQKWTTHITLSQRHHGKTNISKIVEGFKNIIDTGADCSLSWISNEGLPRAFKLVNKSRINDLSLRHFVTHYFRHKSSWAVLVLHDFLFSMDGHCKNLSQLVISQEPWLLLFSSYRNQVSVYAAFTNLSPSAVKTVITAWFKMQTAWERASWEVTGSEKYYVWRRAL